jgi:DNA-binding response OmpR family regulator
VLIDIGRPGIDGLRVASELRKSRKDVLLIAVTGRPQEADRRRSRKAGFDLHLVKPVDFDELRLLLDQRRATRNESEQDDTHN